MFIGEIAQIYANVSYASKRSLEVQCTVYAENPLEGTIKLTNRWVSYYKHDFIFIWIYNGNDMMFLIAIIGCPW